MAVMRIRGTDLVSCKLDNSSGSATEIKEFVDSLTITKNRPAQPDTRIGDTATRVRVLKPTWSASLSLHPDVQLVDIFYGTEEQEQTSRTLEVVVGDGDADGTDGYTITGEVVVVESPLLVVQGDGTLRL